MKTCEHGSAPDGSLTWGDVDTYCNDCYGDGRVALTILVALLKDGSVVAAMDPGTLARARALLEASA